MSNLTLSFYSTLDRLFRFIKDHQGIELEQFYRKGRGLIIETKKWDLPALTFKMINDGQVYTKDIHQGGEFIKRVIYTTDYQGGF